MPDYETSYHRNPENSWIANEQRGFEDGYERRGFHPPGEEDGEVSIQREGYEEGFIEGAYSVLEEAYPGISEATALMHTEGHSSQQDIIEWLLAPIERKYLWDQCGYLNGYELDGRTIYG